MSNATFVPPSVDKMTDALNDLELYMNNNSNVSVAYILGVHPREKGAHKLMEQALKEKVPSTSSYF